MNSDRLINLLPAEYLPEPEFRAFPIFAAGLLILTVLFVWLLYQRDDMMVRNLKNELDSLTRANAARIEQTNEFIEVQANARFIRSYMAVIPNMVLQSPDYWEIYNEIERLLPEDTWVQSIDFRRGSGKWPDLSVSFLSRGYGFNGPLLTFDRLKGTPDAPTRFRNLRMAGYYRTMIAGSPAASFTIQMEVRYPLEGAYLH